MATVSPPKPWERAGAAIDRGAGSGLLSAMASENPLSNPPAFSALTSTATTEPSKQNPPPIPEFPSTFTSAGNANSSGYYGASGRGGVGVSSFGGMNSAYTSPYNRMGGVGGYGNYGSGMYGGMGGYYGGGMGGSYGGGMGNMYGGVGGPYGDRNDPNGLTNGFTQSTQATFQMIENIVGAFGGFAQMLESTYMATHSSFFAMVSVAEQFGNLRNTLGSILGIFALLRWLRTLFAKLTGRSPPADATALRPTAFASFEGRKLLSSSAPRPSKKPFFFFLAAAFGLPYLMGKLIRGLAASQEADRRRAEGLDPSRKGTSDALLDPSKLEFCKLLYDFVPDKAAGKRGIDLEVRKGDLVAILGKSDPRGRPSEWWWCRTRDGRMGYLPAVYLEDARKGLLGAIGGASTNGSQSSRASSLTSASGSGTLGFESERKTPL